VQSLYPQQAYQAQPAQSVQQTVPRSAYPAQQPMPPRPVQQQAYPVQPLPPQTPVQMAPRPRALPQQQAVQSGWQTPSATPRPTQRAEVPHARQGAGFAREQARQARQQQAAQERGRVDSAAGEQEAPARKKLPGWMTMLMSLMFLGVLALIAFYSLMNAYLVTQARERQAAYNAVLANYHITEQADGRLRVTWQDAIEKYAAQYNLQPAFVTAIIRNESSFRTGAESSVGARGLMQMMPDTAEWIAGKLKDDRYAFDRMWDGETNIRYGCWYLGYLSSLFGGDPILVTCAFHAGQGEVRSWLGNSAISPDGRTVPMENIPISETKTYAGRVTQAYGIYQTLLYPDSAAAASGAVSAGGAVHAADGR
jgi:soluble lytic murein transglycosylase